VESTIRSSWSDPRAAIAERAVRQRLSIVLDERERERNAAPTTLIRPRSVTICSHKMCLPARPPANGHEAAGKEGRKGPSSTMTDRRDRSIDRSNTISNYQNDAAIAGLAYHHQSADARSLSATCCCRSISGRGRSLFVVGGGSSLVFRFALSATAAVVVDGIADHDMKLLCLSAAEVTLSDYFRVITSSCGRVTVEVRDPDRSSAASVHITRRSVAHNLETAQF